MSPRGLAVLHRLLLGWLTFSFVLAWLPLIRALMDGSTYEWGTRYFGIPFSGAGVAGDLWFLIVLSALAIWLLYRGWRNPSRPFAAVLVLWLGLAAADSLHAVLTGGPFDFEGATLGVSISLAIAAPVAHVGFLVLGVIWSVHQAEGPQAGILPPWTTTNAVLGALVVLLFPIQFLLLRAGQGQEAKDVMGVLLTIFQWFLISAALYPWRPRRSAPAVTRAPARA